MPERPALYDNPMECARATVECLGGRIVMGLPLGLGKPVQFVNALYALARDDASIHLEIFTALTLEVPRGRSDLERRFLGPLADRLFAHCPAPDFLGDLRAGRLPGNVRITQFYFAPGQMLGLGEAQRGYVSSNYTHVLRDLLDRGVNLLATLVAVREQAGQRRYSLSGNPDLTLDLAEALGGQERYLLVGQLNRQLPFMPNDAEVGADFFDALLDGPGLDYPPFPVLNRPVSISDYAAGLHVASLVRDGGTLQVGIGSMGDAVVNALVQREHHNAEYKALVDELVGPEHRELRPHLPVETDAFDLGLNGASEMLVHSFAGLHHAGILKRRVYGHTALQEAINACGGDDRVTPELLRELLASHVIANPLRPQDVHFLRQWGLLQPTVELAGGQLDLGDGTAVSAKLDTGNLHAGFRLGHRLLNGRYLESAFFLGPNAFYRWLRALPDEELQGINMTGVLQVNQLYGNERLRRAQRQRARFINEAMMVTLLGAVVSDGLADGQVVSGVGGQYNFVAMAHELRGGRSIIMLPATREKGGRVESNIVWNYAHVTIPRHLRDVVVTEYGAADLRGLSDRDVIAALLCIADSRFQNGLLERARHSGKIEADYTIPAAFRHNLPGRLAGVILAEGRAGWFPHFPWHTGLSPEEARLAVALGYLKRRIGGLRTALPLLLARHAPGADDRFAGELERMELARPKTLRERFYRRLLLAALERTSADGRPVGLSELGPR